jgi:hypothetical protein
MVIGASTYANNAALPAPTPNPWGEFYFDFQTNFLYLGGDLAFLFSHPGSLTATAEFLDNVATNPAGGYASFSATTFGATTGVSAAFCINRIHYGYGTGCGGATGTPNLVQNQDVTGGGSILFTIVSSPASTLSVFALGFGAGVTPLPGGCNLLVLPPVALNFGLTDLNGRASLGLQIPAGITGSFNVQGGVFDATGPAGFTVTNGVSPTAF